MKQSNNENYSTYYNRRYWSNREDSAERIRKIGTRIPILCLLLMYLYGWYAIFFNADITPVLIPAALVITALIHFILALFVGILIILKDVFIWGWRWISGQD